MTVLEYTVTWTGGRIGTGYTNWHINKYDSINLASIGPAIRGWYTGIRTTIPTHVTWTFPAEIREYDVATAELLDAFPITPESSLAGSAAGTTNAAAGRLVRWRTGQIAGGRRVQGRTFLVPTASQGFTTAGSVDPTTISSDNTAHATLITALTSGDFGGLVVWSKTNGSIHEVVSGITVGKATVLRRRND